DSLIVILLGRDGHTRARRYQARTPPAGGVDRHQAVEADADPDEAPARTAPDAAGAPAQPTRRDARRGGARALAGRRWPAASRAAATGRPSTNGSGSPSTMSSLAPVPLQR